MAIIDRNVANEPQPLPKRHLTEAHLLAQYAAEKTQPQQPAARSPSSFQHITRKPPATGPSLFSPATSKGYASAAGTYETGSNPLIRQSILLPSQQAASLSRSPMRSPASTPLQSRCFSVALLLTSMCTSTTISGKAYYTRSHQRWHAAKPCALRHTCPCVIPVAPHRQSHCGTSLFMHDMACHTAETLLTATYQEDRHTPGCLAG